MPSSTNLPLRAARVPAYSSNIDVKGSDLQSTARDDSRPVRYSSMILSPSNSTYWTDVTPPPPKIFPGVVHERTRRGSVRQGSNSEKDLDHSTINRAGAPRPIPLEQDEKSLHDTLVEEPAETDDSPGSKYGQK